MRFRVGAFDLSLLDGGRFWLDGGGMFGVVPRSLWAKQYPPDESNRVLVPCHALLVRAPGHCILVDPGLGSNWEGRWKEILKVTPGNLRAELARHGLQPQHVTRCVLTHLHFDHAGGALDQLYGQWVPAFPNAEYLVQREEFEYALRPGVRDRASYRAADIIPLARSGRIKLVDGDAEPLPGFRLIRVGGHSPGLQAVALESEGRHAYYPSDLVPFRGHLRPTWLAAFDREPDTVLAAKQALLAEAEERRALVILQHEPLAPAGVPKRDAEGNLFLEKPKEYEHA